jgi:uncharacterized membrane protein YsdA (DUF1294 family)
MPAICIFMFFIFVLAAVWTGSLSGLVLALYGVMSIAAFLAYAIDKSAARQRQQRIRENTLHLLALSGGWPGALAAQQLLRHKSSKQSFQTVFWITVIVNCSALVCLVAPQASRLAVLAK